jgi:AraC family transcriptional regulator
MHVIRKESAWPMPTGVKNLSGINIRTSNTVHFGEAYYSPGGTCGPRIQANVQLVVMMAGSATVQIDDITLTIGEHECAVLQPGKLEFWQFSPGLPARHTWVASSPGVLGDNRTNRLLANSRVTMASNRLVSIIELGLGTSLTGPTGLLFESLAKSAIECFLIDVATKTSTGLPDIVESTFGYMEAHLHESLSLLKIASSARVSPQQLTRLFRAHTGRTPMRYLWRLRAERGVNLLSESALTVAEIAQRVGFQSPSHFSRHIQSVYGMSPRELRSMPKSKEPKEGDTCARTGGSMFVSTKA